MVNDRNIEKFYRWMQRLKFQLGYCNSQTAAAGILKFVKSACVQNRPAFVETDSFKQLTKKFLTTVLASWILMKHQEMYQKQWMMYHRPTGLASLLAMDLNPMLYLL